MLVSVSSLLTALLGLLVTEPRAPYQRERLEGCDLRPPGVSLAVSGGPRERGVVGSAARKRPPSQHPRDLTAHHSKLMRALRWLRCADTQAGLCCPAAKGRGARLTTCALTPPPSTFDLKSSKTTR